jgi:hypothetical protein
MKNFNTFLVSLLERSNTRVHTSYYLILMVFSNEKRLVKQCPTIWKEGGQLILPDFTEAAENNSFRCSRKILPNHGAIPY